jgi:hypothetical protein
MSLEASQLVLPQLKRTDEIATMKFEAEPCEGNCKAVLHGAFFLPPRSLYVSPDGFERHRLPRGPEGVGLPVEEIDLCMN